jgi:hypothetical protein
MNACQAIRGVTLGRISAGTTERNPSCEGVSFLGLHFEEGLTRIELLVTKVPSIASMTNFKRLQRSSG